MSRIIELNKTVIKQPELLKQAVEFLNNTKNYKAIDAQYTSDANGRILSGAFHYVTEERAFGRAHVFLKYHGKGTPVYSPEGILQGGHFSLIGDEDFAETRQLGNLIGDSYAAQAVKELLENRGQNVQIAVENGEFVVDGYQTQEIAACSY